MHNVPWVKAWNEKYSKRGLVVIGIHTPETAAERSKNPVVTNRTSENISLHVNAKVSCLHLSSFIAS